MQYLGFLYLGSKAIHVISVFAWMAGLFYLPRLFVYHCGVKSGGEQDKLFCIMERRLYRAIMMPALIMSWLFGLLILVSSDFGQFIDGWWMWVKLVAVIAMTFFHFALGKWRIDFENGQNKKSQRFYRIINEVPTALLIVIVIMVIIRPF